MCDLFTFQIKELCGVLTKLSTDHRNLLYLVEIQPPSTYGIQLQRCLSLTLLHWLVPKFLNQEETGENLGGDRCNVIIPENVKVRWFDEKLQSFNSLNTQDLIVDCPS